MTWRHLLLAKCMIYAQHERLACPSSSPAAMLGNEVAFREKLDQHVWCTCSSHWAPRRQQVLCHCSPLHGNISVIPQTQSSASGSAMVSVFHTWDVCAGHAAAMLVQIKYCPVERPD